MYKILIMMVIAMFALTYSASAGTSIDINVKAKATSIAKAKAKAKAKAYKKTVKPAPSHKPKPVRTTSPVAKSNAKASANANANALANVELQNSNTNNNSNQQLQGQQQGQSNRNNVNNSDTNTNNVNTSDTNTNSNSMDGNNSQSNVTIVNENKREFVSNDAVTFGETQPYNGRTNTHSYGYQRLDSLLMYGHWFTEGALERMAKGGNVKIDYKTIYDGFGAPGLSENTKWIYIYVSDAPYEPAKVAVPAGQLRRAQAKSFIVAWSGNEKTTSVEVLGKSGLKAIRDDCNVLHILAHGADIDAISKGWGIGFNSTHATVGKDDAKTSGGGTGYSRNRGGARSLSWLQGFGITDKNLVPPSIRK